MKPASLTELRKRLSMSQRAFAERLGIGRRTLTNYETGMTPIPSHIALACAALAFGLPEMD